MLIFVLAAGLILRAIKLHGVHGGPRGEDREREEGLVGKENERRGSRSQSGTSGLAAEVWDGS